MTTSIPTLRLALAGTGIGLLLAVAGPAALAADKSDQKDQKEESVRPEVGKPLQEAQDALKAKNWDAALAKLDEADAAKDKTPYETYAIDRTRAAAANGKGDNALAAKFMAAAIETGKMKPDEQVTMTAAVTSFYAQAKDYPNAIAWGQRYAKAGGTDPAVKTIVVKAEYLSGDYAGAARDAQAQIAATEQVGQKPTEDQLTLLASAYIKQNNDAAYAGVLEQVVTYYPTKDRWADLISHVDHKPGFSDRLFLDINRLQRATGCLTNYSAMVDLDLQDGISSEAKTVAGEGGSAVPKALQAKAEAAAAKDRKTLERDAKDAEGFKDGNVLVTIGYTYVGFGEVQKGIGLLEQGIAKGGLKHPDEAKLMLGIAYYQAGQMPKAIETFNSVNGGAGASDVAHLWALKAKQGA